MQSLIGIKQDQGQKFLENGKRIPVTYVNVSGVKIVGTKTIDKDHYSSLIVEMGKKRRELRIHDESPTTNVGDFIRASEIFKAGDSVTVTGISKGKGFAGVVKRHGFHGGPRTHGQSDRERAPGSIGQTTTPGRVYKGKKMAGRMGNAQTSIRNLEVIDVTDEALLLKGLVPGGKKSLVLIKKIGENKKFVPLWKETEEVAEESQEQPSEVSVSSQGETDQSPEPVTTEERQEPAPQSDQPTTQDMTADQAKNEGKPSEARSGSAREDTNAS